MTIGRMTQNMLSHQALTGMQSGLGRLANLQEQLSTGRIINRPSDDPTGTASAMRLRSSIADQNQYARNAADGMGWLAQVDNTLTSMTDQVRRARDLALQGANSGAMGPQAREALATEVDQLRQGLLAAGNTTYLDRPIFGGITAQSAAFVLADPTDPSSVVTFSGVPGAVNRTVADGVKLRVDLAGTDAFGSDGTNIFDHLSALSIALRAGDASGIGDAIGNLNADGDRITAVQAGVGTRAARMEQTKVAAEDASLSLSTMLSEIENTDLPKATVDLKMQEVAYQAALAATARVVQPSLLDFLR